MNFSEESEKLWEGFDQEYDEAERECKVGLNFQDLEILKDNDVKDINSIHLKHWALLFNYGGRKIRYEMYGNESNDVEPTWTDIGKKPKENIDFRVSPLGSIRTSPKSVYDKAGNLAMNREKYRLLDQNCQNWVMDLLESLSPELHAKATEAKLQPFSELPCLEKAKISTGFVVNTCCAKCPS